MQRLASERQDIKNELRDRMRLFYAKKGSKNTKYAKNEIISIIGKNGLHAKAIAFAKSTVWVKK